MFRKSKIRIVAAIMASLMLFLTVTLGAIYLSSRLTVRRENEEMLARYVERMGEDEPGGAPDGAPEDRPAPDRGDPLIRKPDKPDDEPFGRRGEDVYGLSTFYSVVYGEDGSVSSVDTGREGLKSEDEIVAAAEKARAANKSSGRIGRLLYTVGEKDGKQFVAFVDSTVADENLTTFLKTELIAGGAALVLVFLLSLFLSSRIIKPLEENDKRQKRFVSDAGHELKTPISVISANTEILSREGDSEWLSNIRYETERMGTLVRDLLRLSRAGDAARVSGTVDLSRVVVGEELPFESVAFEKGKTLTAEIGDGITVEGDESQLKQLTAILIDNAISHGTDDAVAVTLRAEHRSAVLTVENGGDEIPREERTRLFERFYRADEARTDGDHFGLGLAIAKAIVEAHRGTISVDCRDGRVIFTVTIPLSHKK
ncbi:MAG: HAMP domain-containing histidine kinase [Clostridia bacterium]|nr:HAMP domain-containing histidine kinase [Clostridia bacterium]